MLRLAIKFAALIPTLIRTEMNKNSEPELIHQVFFVIMLALCVLLGWLIG